MNVKKFHKKTKGQKLIFLQNKINLFKIPQTICLNISEEYLKKTFFKFRISSSKIFCLQRRW